MKSRSILVKTTWDLTLQNNEKVYSAFERIRRNYPKTSDLKAVKVNGNVVTVEGFIRKRLSKKQRQG